MGTSAISTGDGSGLTGASGPLVRLTTEQLQSGLEIFVADVDLANAATNRYRLSLTALPAAVPPALLSAPTLAELGRVAEALVVDPGAWAGNPGPDITFQWLRDGVVLAGATGIAYVPVAAEDGARLTCRVTARNDWGSLTTETGPARVVRAAPVATGGLSDLQLTAGTGPGFVEAAAAFAGEGLVFSVTGPGAVIDPVSGQVAIDTGSERAASGVTVVAQNSGGSASVSFAVSVVAADAAPALLAAPTLAGNGRIGSAIVVRTGTWAGRPEPVLACRWLRNGVELPSETGTSYTPTADDDRAVLACRVTAANRAGEVRADTAPLTATFAAPVITAAGTIGAGDRTGRVGAVHAVVGLAFSGSGATVSYQWKRSGQPIAGATGQTYVPTSADIGTSLTCTVTVANSGGSVSATTAALAISDLPALISDGAARAPAAMALPGYLVPFADPSFGTKITRISGAAGSAIGNLGVTWTGNAHHQYSQVQAWNADESLLFVETGPSAGQLFVDGQTYVPALLRRRSFTEARWHPTRAQEMMFLTGNQLHAWNVVADTTTLVRQFTAYANLKFGQYEGNPSNDGTVVALTGTRTSDGAFVVLTYRISPAAVLSVINVTALGKTMNDGKATVSPDGDLLHLYFDDETQSVYRVNGTLVYHEPEDQRPSHCDMAKVGGVQVVVGPDRPRSGGTGRIVSRSLAADSLTVLHAASYCYHTSARNHLGGAWCICTYHQDSRAPHVGEIVAVRLDGTAAYRICHTRSTGTSYDHEPQASPSPTGKRVVFASDWGAGDAGNVHLFVADFRDFALPAL